LLDDNDLDQDSYGQRFSHQALHQRLMQQAAADERADTPDISVRATVEKWEDRAYRRREGYGLVHSRKLWLVNCQVRALIPYC